MPYTTKWFKDNGYYDERTGSAVCSFDGGKIVRDLDISDGTKQLLRSTGGTSYGGDRSSQDAAIITAILSSGVSPADAYATFADSIRGRDARERKNGHFEDYLQRTISKQVEFLDKHPRPQKKDTINLDFSNPKSIHKSVNGELPYTMCSDIAVKKLNWIWEGFIPEGKITVLAGDPRLGKSTLIVDIIARISRGMTLPLSEKRAITGTCLIASAEDSEDDTIIPRLISAGANLRKVGIIPTSRIENGELKFLTFPRDLGILSKLIIEKGSRILVIDPLNSFLEKGTDSHKDQDIRRILHPIESIAHDTGCAIVVLAHFNKRSEEVNSLYRVGGSIGLTAAARSVLGVTKTNEGKRILYSIKSNLSVTPIALEYEIKSVNKNRIGKEWKGENNINSSSISWGRQVEYDPDNKGEAKSDSAVVEMAGHILRQILANGPVETDDVYAQAKKLGVSKIYINRVKYDLEVRPRKIVGKWYWELPAQN
jgi:hypothetical protein